MNAQLHREAAEDTNFRKQVITDDHVRKVPFSLQIPKQKKENDLSFIISTSMNLYEHQSSTNLNMPLRGLIYFSQLYQQYVRRYGYSLYAKSQIPLPFPNYIVFYNGLEDMPDEEELLLSNTFPKEMTDQLPAVECRVRLLLEEYDAEEVLRYREREAAKDPAYQLQLLSQYGI